MTVRPATPSGVLCGLGELKDPDSRGFDAQRAGTPWDFFLVHKDGRVFGYRNQCPHTGAPLDWMPDQFLDPEGSLIQCAMHGALFRVEDGLCVQGPCAGRSLSPVPLRIVGNLVIVAPRVD